LHSPIWRALKGQEDVLPYAVAVGNPMRTIRFLEPDDTEAVRQKALQEYSNKYN
jgi:alpha-D-ribose 1-methylphosphonate 5-phosphate C-P lyase